MAAPTPSWRSEEHTSELQSQSNLVCRLLLEKKKLFSRVCLRRKKRDAGGTATEICPHRDFTSDGSLRLKCGTGFGFCLSAGGSVKTSSLDKIYFPYSGDTFLCPVNQSSTLGSARLCYGSLGPGGLLHRKRHKFSQSGLIYRLFDSNFQSSGSLRRQLSALLCLGSSDWNLSPSNDKNV